MDLVKRVEQLERRLKVMTAILALAALAAVTLAWTTEEATIETLRVRELIVVDDTGTERVWIGAPVPTHLVRNAKPTNRPLVSMSGILLLDAQRQVRSIYASVDKSGKVFLVGAGVD